MNELITSVNAALESPHVQRLDEAELAAAAFLARYSGRTLDAYRIWVTLSRGPASRDQDL